MNCNSGVINLKTGELLPHDRELLMRKLAPVDFNPKVECPIFLRFLDRIFEGDGELIRFVQRAIGYSLTSDTSEQCTFVLNGTGANGKTTLIHVIQDLLGDYAQQTPMETLMATKPGGVNNEPPPNWWTPLISSDRSGKVSNGPGTASFYG
jgi:putative DNA primase/helicase